MTPYIAGLATAHETRHLWQFERGKYSPSAVRKNEKDADKFRKGFRQEIKAIVARLKRPAVTPKK